MNKIVIFVVIAILLALIGNSYLKTTKLDPPSSINSTSVSPKSNSEPKILVINNQEVNLREHKVKEVIVNDITYEVSIGIPRELCAGNKSCGFIDTTFISLNSNIVAGSLEVWMDNKGVFLLNLVPIKANGFELGNISISKKKGTLTPSEINKWKEILANMEVK